MITLPILNILQSLFEPAFYALFGGMVVGFVFQGVWGALHGGEFIFVIMGILIAFAVANILHKRCGGVADDQRHGFGQVFQCIFSGREVGGFHSVGFRRQGHINYRFGEMDVAFRHADEAAGGEGRYGDFQGPGIGQSYVFGGKPGNPPGNIDGIFAGFQHAGQPVYGRIGIGVAHGFV